ncbi:MAG: phenylacetate--CoA ligase family protein [Acidimicrobiales bacterium]
MTATNAAEQPRDPLDELRADFMRRLPAHVERLTWGEERLRAHQTEQLRELLRVANESSPFHRPRLLAAGIDPDAAELADLARLPVMTKADVMDRFDDVVTDRRLTRATVDRHIAAATAALTLFLDDYLIVTSGGSSGRRGVYPVHRSKVADFLAGGFRSGLAPAVARGTLPRDVPVCMVCGGSSIHVTSASAVVLDGTVFRTSLAPATLPVAEMAARVHAAQPLVLVGYPWALARLADEQAAGRIAIKPAFVVTTGEQTTDQQGARIARGFGTTPANSYGATEGLQGQAAPGDPVFTFCSDLAFVEFVDEADHPVPLGTPAHHVLVTNLVNTAQPLIRYRLDDRMVQQPFAADHGHIRALVEGRSDHQLTFGDRAIHPVTVMSALLRTPAVSEYQVRVTGRRMSVAVITDGPLVTADLTAALAEAVARAGAGEVEVQVVVVDELERDPHTGKTQRFMSSPPA